jgi:hypothetical protein
MKEHLSATGATRSAYRDLHDLYVLKGKEHPQYLGGGGLVQDKLFNWSRNYLYSRNAKFIEFTKVDHNILLCTSRVQSTHSHEILLRPIPIIPSPLCLGFPRSRFPKDFR